MKSTSNLSRKIVLAVVGVIIVVLAIFVYRTLTSRTNQFVTDFTNIIAARQEFVYVSPNGNDAASGSKSNPLKTLPAALQKSKQLLGSIQKGVVYVVLRDGTYNITSPLVMDKNYNTSSDKLAVWTNYPGEEPIITGRRSLTGTWKNIGSDVWQLPYPSAKTPGLDFGSLYVNNEFRQPSIYPASSPYIHISSVSADFKTLGIDRNLGTFSLSGGVLQVLNEFTSSHSAIASASGNTLKLLTPAGHSRSIFVSAKPGEKAVIQNIHPRHSAGGTWQIDRTAGVVRYRALAGENPNNLNVSFGYTDQLVRIVGSSDQKVKNIEIRGIAFAHAGGWHLTSNGNRASISGFYNWEEDYKGSQTVSSYPGAIDMQFADTILLTNNRIRRVNGIGVRLQQGVSNVSITGNAISDIGSTCIQIGTYYQPPTGQESKNISIENNLVDNCGTISYTADGIWQVFGDTILIRNNIIQNTPAGGVFIGMHFVNDPQIPQRNVIVRDNIVRNVKRELTDGGAIYFNGSNPGSFIENNVVHNVYDRRKRDGQLGFPPGAIYFDIATTGITVKNNVMYDIESEEPFIFHKASPKLLNIGTNYYGRTHLTNPDVKRIIASSGLSTGTGPAYCGCNLLGYLFQSPPKITSTGLSLSVVPTFTVARVDWRVYDSQGKNVISKSTTNLTLDLSALPDGNYKWQARYLKDSVVSTWSPLNLLAIAREQTSSNSATSTISSVTSSQTATSSSTSSTTTSFESDSSSSQSESSATSTGPRGIITIAPQLPGLPEPLDFDDPAIYYFQARLTSLFEWIKQLAQYAF